MICSVCNQDQITPLSPLWARVARGPRPTVPILWTQKASAARREACVRGVPPPETVAACACQISMGESRSNNTTQNPVKQQIWALASTCVCWRCRRTLWSGVLGSLQTGLLEMRFCRTLSAVLQCEGLCLAVAWLHQPHDPMSSWRNPNL